MSFLIVFHVIRSHVRGPCSRCAYALGALPLLVFIPCETSLGQDVAVALPGRTVAVESQVEFQSQSSQPRHNRSTRVTLVVRDSTVRYAVDEIARQANLEAIYNYNTSAFKKRITVSVVDVSPMDALKSVLNGTGLAVDLSKDARTILIRPSKDSTTTATEAVSGIVGRVLDSGSRKPVSGAVISVENSRVRAMSTNNGEFRLRLSPGKYVIAVKLFGYRSATRTIVIPGDTVVRTQFVLTAVASTLTEVVTTITGEKRNVEIGNDITRINVPDVISKYPVSTMSELLANRVPGLYAAPTSGRPGAPTWVRIRGVSSLNLSNEPMIVVDGAVVRNIPDSLSTGIATAGIGFDFSPLDRIDPNSVESVEVQKGPSAVAMYGSDAANGVIVITTKRGQAGPARWTGYMRFGTTTMPGVWPENYYARGHSKNGLVSRCDFARLAAGVCVVDTLIKYQILNDPATTVFGTGLVRELNIGVSGGTKPLTYLLSGTTTRTLGLVKLPDVDLKILQERDIRVPSWQRRPESFASDNGTANLNMSLGSAISIGLVSSLTRASGASTPLSDAVGKAAALPPAVITYGTDWLPIETGSGLLEAIADFRSQGSQQTISNRHSFVINSNLTSRIHTTLTAGLDMTSSTGRNFLRNGDCYNVEGVVNRCKNEGAITTKQSTTLVKNVKFNMNVPVLDGYWLKVRSSIGGEFSSTTLRGMNGGVVGLQPGSNSGSLYSRDPVWSFGESFSDTKSAGVFAEVTFGLPGQLWFPLAIRSDAGSTFGSNIRPKFPKLSTSVVVSEQEWFRRVPVLGDIQMLRLRGAFGVGGKQPGVGSKVKGYRDIVSNVSGVAPVMVLWNVGNPELRPERRREFEGGFDADVLDSRRTRLTISATASRSKTVDMIVDDGLAPSVGSGNGLTVNLGDVQNTSLELHINGQLNLSPVSWTPDIGLTKSSNKVLSLNARSQGVVSFPPSNTLKNKYIFQRNVPGYPLFANWARPIRGYADRNGDGFITDEEVMYSDSTVYVGAPFPNFTMSFANEFSLFNLFRVTGMVSYQNGLTQQQPYRDYERVRNDPSLTLEEQAVGGYSPLTHVASVSVARFESVTFSWMLPRSLSRRAFGDRSVTLSLEGKNVGMWTNYTGKDPNVGAIGETVFDGGELPAPRTWGFSLRVN